MNQNTDIATRARQARQARQEAARRYPNEIWQEIEPYIFIATGRIPKNKNQQQILEKELVQARILTAFGSTVYLLPEYAGPDNLGEKHPDAVVDGSLMEFKTITGSARQIEHRFKDSRKKGANRVFFKIDGPLSKEEVIKKLESAVIQKQYSGGQVIAYFSNTKKIYFWNVDDLT